MSENEKKKKRMSRRFSFWKIFTIFGVFIVLAIWLVLYILGPIIGGEIRKTSLDSEYIPTAEYLLINPMPTPEAFSIQLNIEQDVGSLYSDDNLRKVEWFCIEVTVPIEIVEYYDIMQMEFNYQKIYGYAVRSMLMGYEWYEGLEATPRTICSHGAVETGLHIISIRLNHEFYGGEYIHEWAVEITNDGYTYIQDYPNTEN